MANDIKRNKKIMRNEFYGTPLNLQQEKIVCSSSSPDKELIFSASINQDTALTTFCFDSGTPYCKLSAAALEDPSTRQPWIGTRWKLKAQDETHVKIFTDDGECQLFWTY
jgi:hypothetical protein